MAVIPQLLMHFFCQLIQKRNQTNLKYIFCIKKLKFYLRDLYVRTFTSCFTIKSETTAAVQKKREREGERRKPCCRLFVLLFYLLLGIPNKFRENNSATLKSASKFCAVLPPGGSSTPEKVWHSVEKDRRRPIISQVILVPTNPVPRWMGRCGRCFGWWGGHVRPTGGGTVKFLAGVSSWTPLGS